MSPILGIIASQNYSRVAPDTGAMFPIGMVSVGSAGSAEIDFTSIPGTYKHLQLRAIARGTFAGTLVSMNYRINGETGSFYSAHHLGGDGANPYAYAGSSATSIDFNDIASANNTANVFSAFILDILDYADTNKFTTIRGLLGRDFNGSGAIELNSGLYQKTTAVTSIKLRLGAGNFAQYSSFALYGIKG